jgi:hypothetical protein
MAMILAVNLFFYEFFHPFSKNGTAALENLLKSPNPWKLWKTHGFMLIYCLYEATF